MKEIVIVADPGSTHMGKLSYAKELMDVALMAGASCIKFQLFKGEEFTSCGNIELNYEMFPELVAYSQQIGIPIAASIFDKKALELALTTKNIHHVKFGYSKRYDYESIQAALTIGRRVVTTTDEFAMRKLPKHKKLIKLFVAQIDGKTLYPCRFQLNFHNMFPEYYDGFSDHTLDNTVAMEAKKQGATWFEKHLTLPYSDIVCPDAAFALKPDEFKHYVDLLT